MKFENEHAKMDIFQTYVPQTITPGNYDEDMEIPIWKPTQESIENYIEKFSDKLNLQKQEKEKSWENWKEEEQKIVKKQEEKS